MDRQPTRVLLIEDDEDDYILLQKILAKISNEHYVVRWERTYASGLSAMEEGTHDICMIDYRLGASNGIDLLREARSHHYRRPIVLLTGANEGEIDIQALQAGADDYIAKEQLQGELLYRIIRYAIERKKTEHEREKLLSEQIASRELEQRRTEFIGMVVHELKTPLTSLKGYVQLLRRKYERSSNSSGRERTDSTRGGDEQVAQFVARMDAQISKLTDLVEDFLDVTRIAGGRLQLREDYFIFDDLVEEIVQEFQMLNGQMETQFTGIGAQGVAQLDGKGASLQSDIPSTPSTPSTQSARPTIRCEGQTNKTIWGDRLRIGQVITNLLSNALKYASATESIVVKTCVDAGVVTLCVQDTGPGIPPDLRKRVFEPFYRIEKNEHRSTPGLGLGLHIAAEIIQRHHGRIWVESEEGKGATFCFTLPSD